MFEQLMGFLENGTLSKILNDYNATLSEAESPGFNVFTIISDLYFRENFHSDVLAAFLDPNGEHGEGNKFLMQFISMLDNDIWHYYGKSTTVHKEFSANLDGQNGRIDILIKNNEPDEKHCIIIENKLYDAPDMPRQLKRYYEYMTKDQEYVVDHIAYIPLSPEKIPGDTLGIKSPITIVSSNHSDKSEKSLVDDWIDPCINQAVNIDCISILRQYKKLLISLKPEIKTTVLMNKLIEFLREPNNLECAIRIKDLLQNKQLNGPLLSSLEKTLKKDLDKNQVSRNGNGLFIALNPNKGFGLYVYPMDFEDGSYSLKIPKLFEGEWIRSNELAQRINEDRSNESESVYKFGFREDQILKDVIVELCTNYRHSK